MNPAAITEMLKRLFGDLFTQGQQTQQPAQSAPAPVDYAGINRDTMSSQAAMQKQMLDSVFGADGRPNSKIAQSNGATPYHGLDALYEMNPHLNPSNFSSPTSPERFNTGVYGDPAGPPAYQPPTGTKMEGGQQVPMAPTDIFSLMAPPPRPLGANEVATNQPVGGPSTITQNGVQAPLNLFLQGAQNAGTKNYQAGLTPEQLLQLQNSPLFGKKGSPGTFTPPFLKPKF